MRAFILAAALALAAAIPANAEPCAPNHAASCTSSGYATGFVSVQATSEKGQANGYAGLDAQGKVPTANLPAGGSEAFPVGSIFLSTVSTNPSVLLGYGSWTAIGAGRMLVGFDAGQTEFDALGETGGAKSTTLTTTELPAHTHTLPVGATDDTSAPFDRADAGTNTGGANATTASGSAGSGAAFTNLPPYLVISIWRRDS